MPEGHLVSAPPLCQPCSAPQGQAESGGMVLVAYAGPVRPAAALRDSVLCLPTDIHSLFVNKPSSSSSSSSSSSYTLRGGTSPGHAHSDAPGCRVSSAGTRPEATEQALSTFQQTRGPPPQTVPPWLLCDVRCQADTRSATAGDGDGISWELETT